MIELPVGRVRRDANRRQSTRVVRAEEAIFGRLAHVASIAEREGTDQSERRAQRVERFEAHGTEVRRRRVEADVGPDEARVRRIRAEFPGVERERHTGRDGIERVCARRSVPVDDAIVPINRVEKKVRRVHDAVRCGDARGVERSVFERLEEEIREAQSVEGTVGRAQIRRRSEQHCVGASGRGRSDRDCDGHGDAGESEGGAHTAGRRPFECQPEPLLLRQIRSQFCESAAVRAPKVFLIRKTFENTLDDIRTTCRFR